MLSTHEYDYKMRVASVCGWKLRRLAFYNRIHGLKTFICTSTNWRYVYRICFCVQHTAWCMISRSIACNSSVDTMHGLWHAYRVQHPPLAFPKQLDLDAYLHLLRHGLQVGQRFCIWVLALPPPLDGPRSALPCAAKHRVCLARLVRSQVCVPSIQAPARLGLRRLQKAEHACRCKRQTLLALPAKLYSTAGCQQCGARPTLAAHSSSSASPLAPPTCPATSASSLTWLRCKSYTRTTSSALAGRSFSS